jgi:UDP-N-acetylmuramyl pentapeptide phosphotransferase/UDP-N-acetylglucosamine-1-phosphate transferase
MLVFLVLWTIAHFFTGAILAAVIGGALKRLLHDSGALKQNYRQRDVVNMMGLSFIMVWLVMMAMAAAFGFAQDIIGLMVPERFQFTPDMSMPLTILILGVGMFGLIDDLLGSRESTGFRGHIGQLLKGRLTTGALKALGIPTVAFFAIYQLSGGPLEAFGDALLIALFVNTLNLLDLRPGRALKVFIPLLAIFFLYAPSSYGLAVAALLGVALVLLRADLKEEIMLGDVGSNVIGAVLGFSFVITFGWSVKLPLIIVFVALQILTERYSLTRIIENTPVLREFDRLGRNI